MVNNCRSKYSYGYWKQGIFPLCVKCRKLVKLLILLEKNIHSVHITKEY